MEQLLAFLDSVRKNYPFGIPRSVLSQVGNLNPSEENRAPGTKLLLVTPKLSDSGKILLAAAMEKGLKIANYEILEVSVGGKTDLNALISQCGAAIIFDVLPEISEGRQPSGGVVVRAIDPEKVVRDPSLKKEFWIQIQRIIPEINK